MKGKEIIEKKVEDFSKNEKTYLDKSFQETEARNRFIDPFFQALGWEFDQTHLQRNLWDVHREYSQKDNSSTKKPDYAFRLNGKLKFFVEAKAPWVPLTDKDPVFQAKRYAYSTNGKAPIVIITDFQEFRVFNSLQKPIYENPNQGLITEFDLKYTDYLNQWDFIYEHFSKEAVLDGSLEKLRGKISRSTKPLDIEFLSEITLWRENLAKNIAIRNELLTVDELNEAVQRILDRLVFIRNLEDREIVNENTLLNISRNREGIYENLLPLFSDLNVKYNGLLFKPHFSETLIVDDRILKETIQDMCYPRSPFQFDVIEPEILGRIYEKFLGSKIRLTESHRAKVEEKEEVRHAGGVYYTPQFIVDYIVKETVGKRIEGLKPEEIEKIKILDPACGSGSFLLGAYNYLMEYHRSFYSQNISIKKYKTDYFETQDGELKLSIKKKGEILINNIFGVDVDREATEVAILSLYLKLLEHGIEDDQGWLFLKGKILPDMTMNIQYGNSLISREELFANDMFGNEKIRPFDWKNEVNGFGSIFNYSQGFDCVIGNPPYIKTQELQKSHPHLIELYKKIYTSGSTGNYDIYILFIEKALSLINRNGLIGFICPHKFFNSTYGMKIRELLSQKKALNKVLHFGVNQIFENATTYTCLLFLTGQPQEKFEYYEFRDEINDIEDALNSRISYFNIKSNVVDSSNWVFVNSEENNFLEKMRLNKPTLIDIATNIFQGPKAGADPVFIVKLLDVGKKNSLCYSSSIQNEFKIENSIIKPYVKGKYIRRYNIEKTTESIIFPYNKEGKLISEEELKADYPLAYKYLSDKENKRILLQREEGRFKNIWWSYSRPQNMQILDRLKILTPFNAFKSSFSLDSSGDFIFSAGVSGAYGILIRKDVPITYYYLLGILNSRLLDKFLKTISTALRGGFFSYENKYIRQLPIYIPTESEPKKYAQCKKIEEFVQ